MHCELLRLLALWVGLGGAAVAGACEAVRGPARPGDDGSWTFDVTASALSLGAVGAQLREDGTDLIVEIGAAAGRRVTDIPPTRYADERVFVPFWRSGKVTVRVRGVEVAAIREPSLAVRCIDAWQPGFAPVLAWSMATDRAYAAQHETDEARRGRLLAEATALTDGAAVRALDADAWSGPAGMLRGYLATLAGRQLDAAAAFAQAESSWGRDADAQALAARFYRAKAQLAAGRIDEADALLDRLTAADVQARFPAIAAWAQNDRCLILRRRDRRAEAADCLASLASRLQAIGEHREAANVLCNLGSTQGALERWDAAAVTLERCRAARQALGSPDGMAHAQLLLGWALLEAGRVEDAAEQLQQSLDHARRAGEPGQTWDAQRWLAQTWIEGDDLDRARSVLSTIEPDAQQDATRHAEWTIALGTIALLRNETRDARALLGAGTAEFEALGNRIGAERARCRLALVDRAVEVPQSCNSLAAAEVALRRGQRDAALRLLADRQPIADAELLREALRALYGSAADRLDRLRDLLARAVALAGANPRVAGVRERLLSRLGFEFARAAAQPGADPELARFALVALLHAGERSGAIGVRVTGLSPLELSSATAASVPALPSLERGETWLASARWLDSHYLVVAQADGSVRSIGLDVDKVDDAIAALRSAIDNSRPTAAAARALSGALELDAWLPATSTRLRLIVQGNLVGLPWPVLAIPGEPIERLGYRPLVEQAAISHIVVGLRPFPAAAMPRHLVLFGDAEAARDSLPGVAYEATALSRAARAAGWRVDTLPVGRVWDDGPLGVLHIGGHARADAALGGLYVATGSGWQRVLAPDDAVRVADLVVLAGCETADGAVSRWSGNRSLGVRVLERGAKQSLAHLWPVDDMAAAQLHIAFYAGLYQGAEPDEALARAQRARLSQRIDAAPRRWASGVIFTRLRAEGARNGPVE